MVNEKLQGSAATHLRCSRLFSKFAAWRIFKIPNIWRSIKTRATNTSSRHLPIASSMTLLCSSVTIAFRWHHASSSHQLCVVCKYFRIQILTLLILPLNSHLIIRQDNCWGFTCKDLAEFIAIGNILLSIVDRF